MFTYKLNACTFVTCSLNVIEIFEVWAVDGSCTCNCSPFALTGICIHSYLCMSTWSFIADMVVHHFIGWFPGESRLAHYPNTVGFVPPLVPEQNFKSSDRNLLQPGIWCHAQNIWIPLKRSVMEQNFLFSSSRNIDWYCHWEITSVSYESVLLPHGVNPSSTLLIPMSGGNTVVYWLSD